MSKRHFKPVKTTDGLDIERADYDYHLPVFLKQAVDYLVHKEDGIYVDGTLGGGGHSAEILKRLSKGGKLLAFDKDEKAIDHCNAKFRGELDLGADSRIELINECYSKAFSIESYRGRIDGFLLDLGVSSRQLDDSRRGFSYRANTSLDMRFGSSGQTAESVLHTAKEEELERILRNYGEEPFAGKIARRIIQRRRAFPLKTTFDLRAIIEETVPKHLHNKTLSRVFQAFRIVVNKELSVLEDSLSQSLGGLASGGRIVIISYHSLEDRIVKNFFKEHMIPKYIDKHSNSDIAISVPKLKIITPKPIIPDEAEIASNPRARSAKMRVAEKAG